MSQQMPPIDPSGVSVPLKRMRQVMALAALVDAVILGVGLWFYFFTTEDQKIIGFALIIIALIGLLFSFFWRSQDDLASTKNHNNPK